MVYSWNQTQNGICIFLECTIGLEDLRFSETLIAILVDVIPTIIIHYSVQTMEV